VLHGVLYLNFKLCAFVVNGLIKEEIEKPSGQFLDSAGPWPCSLNQYSYGPDLKLALPA
jgi:hypothetical protein